MRGQNREAAKGDKKQKKEFLHQDLESVEFEYVELEIPASTPVRFWKRWRKHNFLEFYTKTKSGNLHVSEFESVEYLTAYFSSFDALEVFV